MDTDVPFGGKFIIANFFYFIFDSRGCLVSEGQFSAQKLVAKCLDEDGALLNGPLPEALLNFLPIAR